MSNNHLNLMIFFFSVKPSKPGKLCHLDPAGDIMHQTMYSTVAGNGRRTRIYLTVDIIIKKYSFSCNCSLKYGRFM